MGFIRHGQLAEVNLSELAGQLIALQYAGEVTNVTSEVPEQGKVTQNVTRARVVTFNPDGSNARQIGETLVFQTRIAEILRDKPQDWHGGVLEQIKQRSDASRTVYVLTAPENATAFDRMESALSA